MRLTASRHIAMLQRSFLTFPDGSHFINTKLCHSPGTAHRVLSSQKLRRGQALQGKLDTLRGMACCPRACSTSVCGARHRHPRRETPAQLWHCFGQRVSSSRVSVLPHKLLGRKEAAIARGKCIQARRGSGMQAKCLSPPKARGCHGQCGTPSPGWLGEGRPMAASLGVSNTPRHQKAKGAFLGCALDPL